VTWEFKKTYTGNSDIILKKMKENGLLFDLILTDPPYNIGKDFGNDSDKLSFKEFIKTTKGRISVCKDLLNKNGSILWFGIHDYISFVHVIMYKVGLHYRRQNIWHYENGSSRMKRSPTTHYEPFLWFSKSNKKWTYNVDNVRVPYKSTQRLKTPVKKKLASGEIKTWIPNPKGAMRGDVWKFPVLAGKAFEKERTEHPTQKPESLITELIKAYCPMDKEGKLSGYILDPFHGSGTLGVCCEKLNRAGHSIQWIGIEMEKKWVDIGENRIKKISREDRNERT